MKRVAIVFTRSPHGSAAGREGLDALLAISALVENIGVFFISDGVFQLLPCQQPAKILARNYIAAFPLLSLCDIDKCYICKQSLQQRGLNMVSSWVLDGELLTPGALRNQLITYDVVLTF